MASFNNFLPPSKGRRGPGPVACVIERGGTAATAYEVIRLSTSRECRITEPPRRRGADPGRGDGDSASTQRRVISRQTSPLSSAIHSRALSARPEAAVSIFTPCRPLPLLLLSFSSSASSGSVYVYDAVDSGCRCGCRPVVTGTPRGLPLPLARRSPKQKGEPAEGEEFPRHEPVRAPTRPPRPDVPPQPPFTGALEWDGFQDAFLLHPRSKRVGSQLKTRPHTNSRPIFI